jgi:hypothetical protein
MSARLSPRREWSPMALKEARRKIENSDQRNFFFNDSGSTSVTNTVSNSRPSPSTTNTLSGTECLREPEILSRIALHTHRCLQRAALC